MFKTLTNIIRRYPEQAVLFLFNTGVFAWLQVTGFAIATKLGFTAVNSEILLNRVPSWLQFFASDSLDKLQNFFGSSAIVWLVISMILAIVIRFIKGLVKFIIFSLIIIIGILLILQNQHVLQNLSLF